ALAGCSDTGATGNGMPGMEHGNGSSSAPATNANEADIMFATMMIEHHRQAIEMSDAVLTKEDVDPRVTSLAEDIKAAQQPEIDLLEGWLEEWGADSGTGMDGMDHGDGMMTEEDMQDLEAATGPDASRLFLEQMIEHHNGAITMAQDQV